MLVGRARSAYTRLLFLAREHYDLLVTKGPEDERTAGAHRAHDGPGEAEGELRMREAAMSRVRKAFRDSIAASSASAGAADAEYSGIREQQQNIERAEYVVREVEALVKLHKYRWLKKKYYD